MGYYSSYSITVLDTNGHEAGRSIGEFEDATEEARRDCERTWYGWVSEMTSLSALHPGLVFHVSRHGEDSEDIEDAWFFQGRVRIVRAVVSHGEFTPPETWES